jgi:adenosine deaminase
VTLPTEDLEELRALIRCPPDCPDLVTFLKCFELPQQVLQYPYAITRVFYEACEDAVKDGISCIELRFAPACYTVNNYSYSQILDGAIQGCLLEAQRLPITPRIICCAMRNMDPEVNADIAEICWRYRHSYVVGFDLAGPEQEFPPHKHVKAFRTIRRKSLSVTMHGTRICEDARVLNEVIDRRIPIEMCVTSNVQTKPVEKLEDRAIKRLFDLGVRTVPCTDNPILFGVTLSDEYLQLHEKFGFTVADILKLIDFGFRSAFVDVSMKKRLRIEAFFRAVKVFADNGIEINGLNEFYYGKLGLTIPPQFHSPVQTPPLPLPLIQQLPKVDLDCRLIGSIPIPSFYRFFTDLPPDDRKALQELLRIPQLSTPEEFSAFLRSAGNRQMTSDIKNLAIALLQTERNLRQGVHDLLYEAAVDNVAYLELTVCPLYHIRKGVSKETVLDCLLDEIEKFTRRHSLQVGIVINANLEKLSPLEVHGLAALAFAYYERGVCGFATTTAEISPGQMRFFAATFDYLSENSVPVTLFAGEKDAESIPCALVRGHAGRLAGGLQITESESLLRDVTSHNTPVLISLDLGVSDRAIHGWKRSLVRYLTDFGVKPPSARSTTRFRGCRARSSCLFSPSRLGSMLCCLTSSGFRSSSFSGIKPMSSSPTTGSPEKWISCTSRR